MEPFLCLARAMDIPIRLMALFVSEYDYLMGQKLHMTLYEVLFANCWWPYYGWNDGNLSWIHLLLNIGEPSVCSNTSKARIKTQNTIYVAISIFDTGSDTHKKPLNRNLQQNMRYSMRKTKPGYYTSELHSTYHNASWTNKALHFPQSLGS